MNIGSLLNFDKFVTPSLIVFIYWIGLVVVLVTGLGMILTSFSQFGGGILHLLGGLLYIVAGGLLWRVSCEIMLLAFRIYDRLTEIKSGLDRQ